jgi:hypothetical protein
MCRDDENPNLGGERTNLSIPPVTDLDIFRETDIRMHQFAGFIESGAFGQLMAAKEWGGSILIGPWNHKESRRGTKVFPEAMFDFKAEHHKWFDAVLKGVENGFAQRPPFIYYTQNAKAGEYWRCSDTWPLETVRPMTLYLSQEHSGTCQSAWDGTLSQIMPEDASRTEYLVDTSVQVFDNGDGATMDRMNLTWDGDMTLGVDSKGLTFTSAPLFRQYETELTGETAVELWVTCTQKDADFFVYLEEVLADGTSKYVSFGCQRASQRTEEARPAWNECGATYHPCMREDMEKRLKEGMERPVRLSFHIEPVAYVFQKNSRIRITITCANKHCFSHSIYDEANLPTIALYQGGETPSLVRVPFVEHTENVYNGTVTFGDYRGPGTLYYFKEHTYLYYNGLWKKYKSESREASYAIKGGTAYFEAGFTFRQEGSPVKDGILQDYRGDAPVSSLFPAHRSVLVAREAVTARRDILFAPDSKSLYMEVFSQESGGAPAPCIVFIHGYCATPSRLKPQLVELVRDGYTVIGIELRPYPPNCFPDYVFDVKGAVRYIRAHAWELGVDPERIGCYGQSLGGNAALMLGVSGGVKELEGTVGGNLKESSRIQAMAVGFGWSDILTMGKDLMEEYADTTEDVKRIKFNNSDGPYAPLAQVIGFSGEGKGMGILREYLERGKAGTDKELDAMLVLSRAASPIHYIGPDAPPAALFAGRGMNKVDIPNQQTYRTFEQFNKYGADCYMFSNTNGDYGNKPEIVAAIRHFFDRHLKGGPVLRKSTAVPGSFGIVEDYKDRMLPYAPVLKDQDAFLFAADYLNERFGMNVVPSVTKGGVGYVTAGVFVDSPADYRYYPDKNMVALGERSAIPTREVKDRAV